MNSFSHHIFINPSLQMGYAQRGTKPAWLIINCANANKQQGFFMESLILDIKVLRSEMILVIMVSFCHLNILRKDQIKQYCKLLEQIEYPLRVKHSSKFYSIEFKYNWYVTISCQYITSHSDVFRLVTRSSWGTRDKSLTPAWEAKSVCILSIFFFLSLIFVLFYLSFFA